MIVEPRALDPGEASDEEHECGQYNMGIPRVVDDPGVGDDWIADEALDDRTRRIMTELVMPRIGLDGRRYWPIDELPREVLYG
jgi:hypothetical protein